MQTQTPPTYAPFFVRLVILVAAALGVALVSPSTYAETSSVQAYTSDAKIDNGTIVQLDASNPSKVKVATDANLQNMFGVTVDRSQLLITSSNEGSASQVYVAVSGTYTTLVSTQGGPISPGDYVTLSAINGVAMKASTDQKTVFGRATASFDGKGVTLATTTLTDSAGTTKTVQLGSIPVMINIQRNPNDKSTKVDVPNALQRVGLAIAEKEVSPVRIYLSAAIAAFSIIVALVIMYAGVRNGVISIGRNPLAKKSIYRTLFEVILTGILVIVVGLFAVYLLLKL